jgi:hypothetical protein
MPERPRRLAARGAGFASSLALCVLVLVAVAWQELMTPFGPAFVLRWVLACFAAAAIGLTCKLQARGNRVLCAAILIGLVALELGSRTSHLGSFDDPVFHDPQPYVAFAGKRSGNYSTTDWMEDHAGRPATVQMNSLGLRGPEIVMPKSAGEVRVLMLGGSTVFNGTTLAQTLPGCMQPQLSEGATGAIAVHNCGVVSFVSGQDLALLCHRLIDRQPDLVIDYGGGNDVLSPCYYDPRPGYPFNQLVHDQTIGEVALPRLVAACLSRSHLLRRLCPSLLVDLATERTALRQQTGFGTEAWELAIVANYRQNLCRMAIASRGAGSSFAAVLQPLVQLKSPLVGGEPRMVGGKEHGEYVGRQYERCRRMFAELQQLFGEGSGIAFIDLSRVFVGHDVETFWDYIHVDNAGNAHIAAALATELRRRGLPR